MCMCIYPGISRTSPPTPQANISEAIFLHHLSSNVASCWFWLPLSVSQRNLQGFWKASVSRWVWSWEPSLGQWEWSSRDVSLETPCGNKTINSETPESRQGQTEPCCMQNQLIFLEKSSVIQITAARRRYLSDSSSGEKSLDTVNHCSIQWWTTDSVQVSELFIEITLQNCKQTKSFRKLDILFPSLFNSDPDLGPAVTLLITGCILSIKIKKSNIMDTNSKDDLLPQCFHNLFLFRISVSAILTNHTWSSESEEKGF